MALRRQPRGRTGVTVGALALVLAACGGGAKPVANVVPTPSAEPTVEPTVDASPQPVSVDPQAAVGTTIVTEEQEGAACTQAFGGASSGTSDGSAEMQTASAVTALRGGKLYVECAGGVLVLDAFSGTVDWSRANQATDAIAERLIMAADHLFVVQTTTFAAEGLNAAFVSRSLTAVDLHTGNESWTTPLEEDIPKADRPSSDEATVVEGPSGDAAHPAEVIVSLGEVTAFDQQTGARIWVRPANKFTDSYLGYGLNVNFDGTTWTATTVRTGKPVWTKTVPAVDAGTPYLIDTAIWAIGSSGVLSVDVRTGQLLLNRVYPKEWSEHLVTPDLSVVYDGKSLQLYRTSDVRHPLWSTPGDSVQPLFVTASIVVVKSDSGVHALDGKTGQLRDDIVLPDGVSDAAGLEDGLLVLPDHSVYELAPPAAAS
jgi:outer membrane protein assembly factor BamB